MAEKNALSRRQFKESEFDGSGYEYNLRSGEFIATIDCKRWGKRKKLVTYMTFEDGRRIVAPTWPRSRYEGLAGMEVGSKIRIIFVENRTGDLCVRRAVLLADSKLATKTTSQRCKWETCKGNNVRSIQMLVEET